MSGISIRTCYTAMRRGSWQWRHSSSPGEPASASDSEIHCGSARASAPAGHSQPELLLAVTASASGAGNASEPECQPEPTTGSLPVSERCQWHRPGHAVTAAPAAHWQPSLSHWHLHWTLRLLPPHFSLRARLRLTVSFSLAPSRGVSGCQ